MIRGYPEPISVPAGESLRLRVSGQGSFHIAVDRLGAHQQRMALVGPWRASEYPDGPCDEAWDWPAYPLSIPADWPSGAYIAHFVPCHGSPHTACGSGDALPVDGRDGRALFVVRPAAGAPRAPLLYKLPLSTYHAYNASGGGSLYLGTSLDPSTGLRAVTLSRPGGGTGGALSFPDAVDVYDPATPREGVAHWDLPFLAWLERAGYTTDVCTDLDLDRDPSLLDGYAAIVTAGHDEYWTAATREAVEGFLAAGGSAAFFSGNACFWRVTLDRSGRLTCRHPPVASAECDQWWRIRSETALGGVSYRHGGGWWSGPRDPLGYTVVDAGHWVFDGTGLREGQQFGAEQRLVGYECDGARLDYRDPDRPRIRPDPGDHAVHLLGLARLGSGWQERADGESAVATMVLSAPGGVVFTAATTDWPRLLAAGDAAVDRITRNVLDRVSLPTRPLHAPRRGTAGAAVPVWVDAAPEASVEWHCSAGTVQGHGGQTEFILPPHSGPVTVSATVYENGAPAGFATRTVHVLTDAQSAQLDVLLAVRALLEQTPPDPLPAVPPGPANRCLADPQWSALQDGLRRPITATEARRIAQLADQVAQAAARLAGPVDDEEPPGRRG